MVFRAFNKDRKLVDKLYHDTVHSLIADMADEKSIVNITDIRFDNTERIWYFDICVGSSKNVLLLITTGNMTIDRRIKK